MASVSTNPGLILRRMALAALAVAVIGLLAVWGRAIAMALRDLHPERAAVDRSEGARHGLEDVSFTTDDGVTLRGWYGGPRERGTVVLVHGHGSSRREMLDQALLLKGVGFGVLLFDLRAHGESGGDLATSGDRERRDVTAALVFLRRRPEAAGVRIGAVGFSVGGIAVAEVASRDGGVAAVVLEATPPTLEDDLIADYPSNRPMERFLGVLVHRLGGVEVDDVRPVDRLCALAPRPLLLIYGSRDPVVPPSQAQRMSRAACGPTEVWIVPGAGHGRFLESDRGEFARRVVPFLRSALLGER
jgi:pimeloyl-ACP methyl ester carboxylesterase